MQHFPAALHHKYQTYSHADKGRNPYNSQYVIGVQQILCQIKEALVIAVGVGAVAVLHHGEAQGVFSQGKHHGQQIALLSADKEQAPVDQHHHGDQRR